MISFRSIFCSISSVGLKQRFWKASFVPQVNLSHYSSVVCKALTLKYPAIMKVDSDEFHGLFTPELLNLLDIFKKHSYEIRMAGGAVRDILLGIKPVDVDFATTATPQEMKAMFIDENVRMINMKGEKHGTITARINNQNFEVTTLRIDAKTDGRHADVIFTKDWILDANRRDLTINSMFLDQDGVVYDYFDGYNDLMNRRIVFVGDANTRMQEDYLRILRYFRFFGRISDDPNKHDPATLKAIQDNVEGLKQISGERIWLELSKIIAGRYNVSLIQRIAEVGALEYIGLPENLNFKEMEAVQERANGLQLKSITYVASLISTIDELSVFHARCRLSNSERFLAAFLLELRNEEHPVQVYKKLLFMPREPIVTRDQITELLKYRGEHKKLLEFESWPTPRFPVKGDVLLSLGVPKGNSLGIVMKELKLHWIDSEFSATDEDLLAMLPSIATKLNIQLKN